MVIDVIIMESNGSNSNDRSGVPNMKADEPKPNHHIDVPNMGADESKPTHHSGVLKTDVDEPEQMMNNRLVREMAKVVEQQKIANNDALKFYDQWRATKYAESFLNSTTGTHTVRNGVGQFDLGNLNGEDRKNFILNMLNDKCHVYYQKIDGRRYVRCDYLGGAKVPSQRDIDILIKYYNGCLADAIVDIKQKQDVIPPWYQNAQEQKADPPMWYTTEQQTPHEGSVHITFHVLRLIVAALIAYIISLPSLIAEFDENPWKRGTVTVGAVIVVVINIVSMIAHWLQYYTNKADMRYTDGWCVTHPWSGLAPKFMYAVGLIPFSVIKFMNRRRVHPKKD